VVEEYDLFIDDPSNLPQGVETQLLVRELKNYETKRVRAILSSSPEGMPGGATLWLRYSRGNRHPSPWSIKILEEYDNLLDR
jgi:hypothetical protein